MSTHHRSRPRRLAQLLLAALLPAMLAVTALPAAEETADADPIDLLGELERAEMVEILLPDEQALAQLVTLGTDLAEYRRDTADGITVHAVVTPTERRVLAERGFEVGATLATQRTVTKLRTERSLALTRSDRVTATAADDELEVLRADWFTSESGDTFVSFEVKSSAGAAATTVVEAAWDGGEVTLSRFTDAGQYLYHRTSSPLRVDAPPGRVTFSSSEGDEISARVREWLPGEDPPAEPHYVSDFVDHYMDPTELDERVEALATEFPRLAEIVELPYETNGYRRKAQALFGSSNPTRFYVTSDAWGHEGGNDLSVALVDPAAANAPLGVTVNGDDVTVSLATNSDGRTTTTAAEVVAALNAEAGDLLSASTYRGDGGSGLVAPAERTALDDNLNAPDSVSHDPYTVQAIRIGRQRDGSRMGVLAYSQEHAREWVTPLVALETAERLLRNYDQHTPTRRLVNRLDVFIIPSVNPDGSHYSFYDYNFQRRNMTNHCGPEYSDPNARNAWGVDINRNFSVGSRLDGYSGASGSCVSDVFSGPSELSEPEARNETWLTDRFDNIKFSMNIHSYGGYFMWSPGAYKAEGRESLPRPTLGEEDYFWDASEHILDRIQEHRGTAIWPGRTGPVIDVLYSAAGNSADEAWYNDDLIAWNFEVGADLYDEEAGRWRGVGFQPHFAEGHEEAMEFSNGLIGMLEVAHAYSRDDRAAVSELIPDGGRYNRPIDVTWQTSEPATVYYTLNGTRPSTSSRQLESSGLREGPESVRIDETTTVRWFSVDMAGNVEPAQRARIRVTDR